MSIILNDVTTVAELSVGDTALIISQHGTRPPAVQACTVDAVYQDSPGWCVDYRYTTVGGAVLHGTSYYHSGTDMIDVITTQEEVSNA